MTQPTSIFDRTLTNLRNAWRGITKAARLGKFPTLRPDLPKADRKALRAQMRECLDAKGGEVSARARAAALGEAYLDLNETGRRRFLEILAQDFAVDWSALCELSREVQQEDKSPAEQLELEARLRRLLTPPHLRLLTQFNSLPSGVKFLVDLRADLRRYRDDDLELQNLDADLKTLLTSWFDVGFLDLKRITWDAPASLLEKLMLYEAVHEIQSWDDLKNRLGLDRRCYAYFHPRMPDEPLIFVQVALVNGISASIQTLLNETDPIADPQAADTAIFYSISNTQPGLIGVSLGSFLIKRVVDDLKQDLPGLKTFATLSPVPGFRRFLDQRLGSGAEVLTNRERETLRAAAQVESIDAALARPHWQRDEQLTSALAEPLTRLCAHYLLNERLHGRAVDPVANFHLNNGARLERINWLADVSPRGIERSAGIMVNYLYKLSDIERNHETYRQSGRAAASTTVKSLAKSAGQGIAGQQDPGATAS